MNLGRDFFGRMAQSAELPSPELTDTPVRVPAIIMPVIPLQGPVASLSSILSPFPSDSFIRSASANSQQVGAGTTFTVLSNFTKGIWRVRVAVDASISAAGAFNVTGVALVLLTANSGGPGSTIGTIESRMLLSSVVEQQIIYEDTLWMNRDFQIAVEMDSSVGLTVSTSASLIAHRLA